MQRRAARPAELASVIAFLLGDGASFMTGTTVVADGGMITQMAGIGPAADAERRPMTTDRAALSARSTPADIGGGPSTRAPHDDGPRSEQRRPLTGVYDVGAEGVDEAVAAARGAQAAWAGLEPRQRGAALFALADIVEQEAARSADVEAADVGKPVGMTPPEIASAIDKIRFYAGASRLLSGPRRGPTGCPT